MNNEEIETFLKVVETGSLVKAGNELYISQGTVSTRIKQLEDRLGVVLFYRQKGIRGITLTRQGEMFLELARKYAELEKQSKEIANYTNKLSIRISATDLLNNYALYPFYESFMQKYPQYELHIETHHSSETYRLLDRQSIDIGLITNKYDYKDFNNILLYDEEMVKVYRNQAKQEIYLKYSNEFEKWHKDHNVLMSVGTISMQMLFIKEDRYAYMPRSAANQYLTEHKDCHIEMTDAPKRHCYLVVPKSIVSYKEEGIYLFIEELKKYIKTYLM